MWQWLASEPLVNSNLMRRCIVPALQKVFVLLRARSKGNKVTTCIDNCPRDHPNEIVALLSDKSRDNCQNGSSLVLRQTKTSQQIEFTLGFPSQVGDRKIGGYVRICFRVPH